MIYIHDELGRVLREESSERLHVTGAHLEPHGCSRGAADAGTVNACRSGNGDVEAELHTANARAAELQLVPDATVRVIGPVGKRNVPAGTIELICRFGVALGDHHGTKGSIQSFLQRCHVIVRKDWNPERARFRFGCLIMKVEVGGTDVEHLARRILP